jgi:hypothetical protein
MGSLDLVSVIGHLNFPQRQAAMSLTDRRWDARPGGGRSLWRTTENSPIIT